MSWLVSRVKGAGYLRKWVVLGAVIGIVAGLGAVVFVTALEWSTRFFLHTLAGYVPPSPFGEGNGLGSAHFARPWAIPLVVGLGGLLSGVLVFSLAPEAEGHGTDAAIEAVHERPKGIRGRVSAIKIVASAITIGSGGSAGREGPTAQISAGFGSLLARTLDLTPADARIAVTVGIGSGIGAIFRAPLGGAVLGAEILYRDDVEVEALIPSMVASIVAFAVFGGFEGFTPIFGFLRGYQFDHPAQLLYFAMIGAAAGLVGILYARAFYGTIALARRVPGARMIKPALAGITVGLIGLALPGALGTGYGWVQKAMGPALLTIPLWVVVALPFAKIAATSLSIGSGGSGGIFGPGMVIGGFVGAGMWRLLSPIAPAVPHSPAPFVVVGMIACFGSIAHAPLAVMLMVAEMTGSLDLLAPAMVAVGVATLIVGDHSIYSGQLKSRADSAAHRIRFGMPLLSSIPVSDVMASPRLVLAADLPVAEARSRLAAVGLAGAPVVDERMEFKGSVWTDRLDDGEGPVGERVDPVAPHVHMDAPAGDAIDVLTEGGVGWAPVVGPNRSLVGIISISDLIRGYRIALERNIRRLAVAPKGMGLLEGRVGERSRFAGRTIATGGWPQDAVVLMVQRGEHLLFPGGDTLVQAGDLVTILARPDRAAELKIALAETPAGEPEGEVPSEGPGLI